jgi:hypothetical protein
MCHRKTQFNSNLEARRQVSNIVRALLPGDVRGSKRLFACLQKLKTVDTRNEIPRSVGLDICRELPMFGF